MSEVIVRKFDVSQHIIEVLKEATERWGEVPLTVSAVVIPDEAALELTVEVSEPEEV